MPNYRGYSYAQKISVLEREVNMRRRVYPALIANGRMSTHDANFQLTCMEEILKDYQEAVKRPPELFSLPAEQ